MQIPKLSQRLILTSLLLGWSTPARSQLIIPANDGTGTIVTPSVNQFDIYGGRVSLDGTNLFHSFEEFGLSHGEIANFLTTPEITNIFGRVVGGNPSIIDGLLQVSGGNSNLFLINPAGIVFGANASLNVPADFTATTATGIGFDSGSWLKVFGGNSWAELVGNPNAFDFANLEPGSIINAGNLAVLRGNNLGLFAGTIANTGELRSPGGNISVVAVPEENLVRLSAAGNVLSLEVSPTSTVAFAPRSLPELLTGGGAKVASQIVVRPDGSVALVGSEVKIDPETGDAIFSGQLLGNEEWGTENGAIPTIQILGNRVALLGATVDVSGANGGGNIFIGGDFQGNGTLPNARYIYVDGNSSIFANAGERGDGGRVIIWADRTTQFFGQISARGAANLVSPSSGNGGFVEISGKENLAFAGRVDVDAPGGLNGTILFDPANLTIVPGVGSEDEQLNGDSQILFADGTEEFQIGTQTLGNLTGNILLEATNDITITDLPENLLLLNGSPDSSISFTADADGDGVGNFSMNSGDTIRAPQKDITISGASLTIGHIDTSVPIGKAGDGGSVTLDATGNIFTGAIDTRSDSGNGGSVTLRSLGDIEVESIDTRSTRDATILENGIAIGDGSLGGNVEIKAGGFFRATGTIFDTGDSIFAAGGNTGGKPTIANNVLSQGGGTIGGAITIRHGGNGVTPFTVGTPSINGTVGNVTSGNEQQNIAVPPGAYLSTQTESPNINIIASASPVPEPSTPPDSAPSPLPTPPPPLPTSDLSDPNLPPEIFEPEPPPEMLGPPSPPEPNLEPISEINKSELSEAVARETLALGRVLNLEERIEPLIESATSNPETARPSVSIAESQTASVNRTKLETALGRSSPEDTVNLVEQFRTDEYEDYLDNNFIDLPKTIANIQESLGRIADTTGTNPAIAYIVMLPSQIKIVLVPPEGTPIEHQLPSDLSDRVFQAAIELREYITRYRYDNAYLGPSQELYRWLIAPMEEELEFFGVDTLLFSMDSGLRALPIAALHDGERFLVEKYSLALIPSFSLVDARYQSIQSSRVLAMGASEFTQEPPLPAVPVELERVAQSRKSHRPFLNEDFTLENLRQQRRRGAFEMVHLATHAKFKSGDPSNSAIYLWNERLTLDRLGTLDWQAPSVELLVLSACETAVGDREAELGFAGLAVQAGVKSAVASLWYVDDVGTLGLMGEFYQQLTTAPIKAEALRQAQLALLHGEVRLENGQLQMSDGSTVALPEELARGSNRDFSHPYYWSGFTVIGSPW